MQTFHSFLLAALISLCLAMTGCATQPPQTPSVAGVEYLGDIHPADGSRQGVLYQDGAQSIAVQDGTLWVFGDTFLGHRASAATQPDFVGMVGTTIAFLPKGPATFPPDLRYFTNSDGIATTPLSLFPDEDPKKLRMWPAGGVYANGRTYLFYSMIKTKDAPGDWNFEGIGAGLAVADQPLAKFQRLTPNGSWRFPIEPICVLPHDGYLYCYETADRPKGLIVARVAPGDIENPSAYRFYAGKDWLPNHDSAKVILTDISGQASVAWNPALHAFLLVSSNFFTPEIEICTANNPWGPWSEVTRIPVQPKPGKTTRFVYGAFLHPELSSPDGRQIIVSFCRDLAGDWELSNPELMRIHLGTPK